MADEPFAHLFFTAPLSIQTTPPAEIADRLSFVFFCYPRKVETTDAIDFAGIFLAISVQLLVDFSPYPA